ncbi:1,3-beta-glucan synthase subunit FKS1-like protein [Tanacetum coccineum]
MPHHPCPQADSIGANPCKPGNLLSSHSQNKYRWNPSIEVDVRRLFNKVGSKSFSDCMFKARKKAEKPEFMNQTTWEALCGVWRLPTFIAKSERGKTARRSNKRLHTGGSIPINEHKTKLREELSREPSVSELFLRTHQNKKKAVCRSNSKSNMAVATVLLLVLSLLKYKISSTKVSWLTGTLLIGAILAIAIEGHNEKYGADDALDARSGNGAKTFPKWIDHVGSKNGTAYGVGDVDAYVHPPHIEEQSAQNIPNVDIFKLLDTVKVQQVEQNLLKTELNNLKKVGKVVANEVGKAVAEEVGKATQQIQEAIRIRPV